MVKLHSLQTARKQGIKNFQVFFSENQKNNQNSFTSSS